MFVKHFYLHKSKQFFIMKKYQSSILTGGVLLVLTIIFSVMRCGNDNNTNITPDVEQFVADQAFVDSIIQRNRELKLSNDSLSVELGIIKLNIPDDKETQTVTRVVTKVVYRDTFSETNEVLSAQLDSLQSEYNKTVSELERNSEMYDAQYQVLLRETLEKAGTIPCEVNYQDEYLTVNTLCTNGAFRELSVQAQDTLVTTSTMSRKWFLGRKSYHVYITNTNPHVTTTGNVYVIDKKLQRKVRNK
jgi:hypothetical protein